MATATTTERSVPRVAPATPNSVKPHQPLPLEAGDRLTRAEFERRYHAMPEVKKAELIEGIVHMPSPVRYRSHGKPHSQIMTWLGVYCASTPGTNTGDNATLRLDQDNEPQPDAVLRLEETRGGKSFVTADDYLAGVPELVIEVASSSASYDLHEKLKVYRRNGIQEYLVWRLFDGQLDWFALRDEQYVPLVADAEGLIESGVFPGLRLNVTALLQDEVATLLADLQKGIGSAAHAAFVEQLASFGQAA